MNLIVRIINGILAFLLFVNGLRHIVGMESWSSSSNPLAEMAGLGTFPELGNTDWDRFCANLLAAVGVLYLKAAVTGDNVLARNLSWARLTIGVLNAVGVYQKTLALPFLFLAVVEIATSVIVIGYTGNAGAEKAASGKKRK